MKDYKLDLVGERFGRLVVTAFSESRVRWGSKTRYWFCLCDCGNVIERSTFNLRSGGTKSCGCLKKEFPRLRKKDCPVSKTKEYASWSGMVARATNPKVPGYDIYSLRGIHPEWISSFASFLEHIGEIPDYGRKYTIERIDNSIGYFPGNVMWLEKSLQFRNKSRRKDNNSGVTGVTLEVTPSGRQYWRTNWSTVNGKHMSKIFSVLKLGYDEAKRLAIEYRFEMLEKLKEEGVVYSSTHGLPRENVDYKEL